MFGDRRKSLFLIAVLIGVAVCVVSVQAACDKGCECLTPAEAKKVGYGYCGGKQTVCGYDLARTVKYCYGKPVPAAPVPVKCGEGCSCLDPAKATASGYEYCDTPHAVCDYDANKNPLYCFRKPETVTATPVKCADGCTCMAPEKAKAAGYTSCGGEQVACDRDSAGNLMFCFSPPVVEEKTTAVPVTCATGCSCMAPEKAKAAGFTYCNEKQTVCDKDTAGNTLYCYGKPVIVEPTLKFPACAKGCSCMNASTVNRTGYRYCGGTRIQCGIDTAKKPLYCFEKLVREKTTSPTTFVPVFPRLELTMAGLPAATTSPLPIAPGCFFCELYGVEPLHIHGAPVNRIDIIFIPDDSYGGDMEQFRDDVRDIIENSYGENDAFSDNHDRLNFYYLEAEVTGLTDWPDCGFNPPSPPKGYGGSRDLLEKEIGRRSPILSRCDYFQDATSFADAIAVIHTGVADPVLWRDWSGVRCGRHIFTSEPVSLRTVIHESGHALFELEDEYCCDANYDQLADHPNIWNSQDGCRDYATDQGWDPDDCVQICDPSDCADWWKIDPDHCVMRCSHACGDSCCHSCGGHDSMCQFELACRARIDHEINDRFR